MRTNEVVEKIDLPYAPKIPGLVFRRFQGPSDYPKMLALINATKDVDGYERSDKLEDIANTYEHLHNSDPYEDMLFFEVDGEPVSYSRVEWNINTDGEWLGFILYFLRPEWRENGLNATILRYDEDRLREIARRLRAEGRLSPDAPRYFETFTTAAEKGKEAVLLKRGYQPVRYAFSMKRSLLEPVEVTPMPPGLEIRTVPPEQFRTVWDAMQEAFRDHWNYIPAPEEEYQRWLASPEIAPNLWKVAWDGDQVAGMVLNFVNESENREYQRKRGYTEGISVRRPWRRQGLARALLTRSLQMFKEMGMTEAALGVDAQNLSGALNLYESVGFRQYQRHTTYRKVF
jgi:ribosomal protein S18 acetylase RimI-like enzyme